MRIFEDSISAIKEAGKEELAQKWEKIRNHCRRKGSFNRKEKYSNDS